MLKRSKGRQKSSNPGKATIRWIDCIAEVVAMETLSAVPIEDKVYMFLAVVVQKTGI
jgi:hypothetical protein